MRLPVVSPVGRQTKLSLDAGERWRPARAFTLTEIMISMAVFMLVLGGVIAAHLFGMRMYEISRLKLGAIDDARTTLSDMLNDLRSAKTLEVGQGSASAFTVVTNGAQQIGNAVQIFPTTNTFYIVYYRDPADNNLKRVTSSNATPTVVARCISNSVVFAAEDFSGTVLTNHQNNRVISALLQFYQLQYPVTTIPGDLIDYYQWRTKVTRRVLD